MLKGALVGFGQVAEKAHAPALKKSPDLSITAVAETSAERRAAAKRLFPEARPYACLGAMLQGEEGLDFVDIATPPHLHARQIELALEHGCHALCEKPLTLSMEELEGVARAAARRGLAVFPVHNWKYAPLLRKLHALVRGGAIGEIGHIEWHVLRTRPASVALKEKGNWRTDLEMSGGGILMDHGWHAFYLIGWLLGQAPRSVWGVLRYGDGSGARRTAVPTQSRMGPSASTLRARRRKAGEAEHEASCLIEYPGATAAVHLTWNSPTRGHWGVIRGERGVIEIHDDRLAVTLGAQPAHNFVFLEPLSHGSAHPEWFQAMLPEFQAAAAAPSGRAAPLEEARQCRWLLDELYRTPRRPAAPTPPRRAASAAPRGRRRSRPEKRV